jgi:hypothetical protein
VENFIDAQSSCIHIEIKGGRFEFIKIRNNDISRLKEDALLLFKKDMLPVKYKKIGRGEYDFEGLSLKLVGAGASLVRGILVQGGCSVG